MARRIDLGRDGNYVLYVDVAHRWPRKKKKAVRARVTKDIFTTLIEMAMNGH